MLEGRILDGSFAPGSRVPTELELADSFGVSRTVVRDALRLLEARGLVEIRRGTGTVVKATSADAYASAAAMMLLRSDLTIGDVFEARAALEGQLAFVAADNHTPEHMARVSAAFDRFSAAVEAADADRIVAAHVDFHSALIRATNLPALEILLRPVQEMMHATSIVGQDVEPTDPRAWRVEVHRQLFEAVASRDHRAVAEANAAHWNAPIRGDAYRLLRARRVADVFPSPAELLRDSRASWSS